MYPHIDVKGSLTAMQGYGRALTLQTCSAWLKRVREHNNNLKPIKGSHKYYGVLEKWDSMSEFEQGMTYGVLSVRVQHMLERGFGRRL